MSVQSYTSCSCLLQLDPRIWNSADAIEANVPAAGGRFSAAGLAHFYADLERLLGTNLIDRVSQDQDAQSSRFNSSNVFQGVVKLDGIPVANAEVEVEFYNEGGSATAPSDLMITQTIKADANGVFTYAVPTSGWWGFAALNTAEEPMQFEGEDKAHELGAVIWVHFEPWGAQ